MIVGKLTGISKWLFRLRNSLRRDTVKVQCTKRKQVEKRYIIKKNIYITKKKERKRAQNFGEVEISVKGFLCKREKDTGQHRKTRHNEKKFTHLT